MVALTGAVASNQRIASTFPDGLVAIFVGGTSGVGEYTVKAFAKYTRNSRAYIIGRSEASAKRILAECRTIGPSNSFEFFQGDISLLKTVDDICNKIRAKETAINILFETQGSMAFNAITSEGISLAASLGMHSRTRFILNLLPLLQRATGLRRVVTVMAATLEGPIDLDNLGGIDFPMRQRRDQFASAQTLLLEKIQEKIPGAEAVGYVHDVPGVVQSGITRDAEGFGMKALIAVTTLLGPLIRTPIDECAEMHLFYATSARYAAGSGKGTADGVPLQGGVEVARGTIGKTGSGVYSINTRGEPGPPRVDEVLTGLRGDGTANKLWEIIMAESKKVTGSESL
ncbi:hypothetical protein SEUCBS139899_003607 [Sporothrix eucalyptigena]|uniref:Uncharacterized protein n=1 Tax=Sporothrix eucalyptigena TaxID=1812306 RepID=A0ABP0C932_9PEZI